jgi:peptidyl-prolyl cis-trans isomerase A (cyclophilin A)
MTTALSICSRISLALIASVAALSQAYAEAVLVCTDRGSFKIELADEAPAHKANFLRLVDEGFYNGTVIHRVVNDAIVQGGAFDRRYARRPAGAPLVNESLDGLRNVRGTVAAARLRDADTATSQFFVNLRHNDELDATSRRPGYTVFGRVTDGLEVLDEIGNLRTGPGGPLPDEVPQPPVVVTAITRIGEPAAATPAIDQSLPPVQPTDIGIAGADTAASLEPSQLPIQVGSPQAAGLPAALVAVNRLRAECADVPAADLVSEADAALTLGLFMRARFALDNYFAVAKPDDPEIGNAQALFRRMPRDQQAGIAPLVAHCPSADLPDLPEGRSASLEDMTAAQAAVRSYIASSEVYLDCLTEVIDRESLDDGQEVATVAAHNEVIERMERIAEAFNRQLRAFRGRN